MGKGVQMEISPRWYILINGQQMYKKMCWVMPGREYIEKLLKIDNHLF